MSHAFVERRGNMKDWRAVAAIAVALALATSSQAMAVTISKSDAQRRVSQMETDEGALIGKLPALAQIDQVVRDDCAQKVPGHASSDSFCTCGAAVTISLWRSGVDPKMIDRLRDFLNGAGTLKAADFVKFEGPELYRPLCALATG